jgi:CrcB protein
MEYLLIFIGGGLGALSRYLTSSYINKIIPLDFPFGTLTVNVLGSFILAFFTILSVEKLALDPNARLFFAVGFLGAFTTFSTFSYETIMLIEDGAYLKAFLNIISNNLLSILAAFLGVALARST